MKCAAFKLINVKKQYLDHLAITARAIKQFKTSLFFQLNLIMHGSWQSNTMTFDIGLQKFDLIAL